MAAYTYVIYQTDLSFLVYSKGYGGGGGWNESILEAEPSPLLRTGEWEKDSHWLNNVTH